MQHTIVATACSRVIKTYLHDGFYPSVNQKGGEPFLVLRLILSGGCSISLKMMFKAGVSAG